MKENDKLALFYTSANRDEALKTLFRFDITRSPNEHLAFGVGEHFASARVWLGLVRLFEAMAERMTSIEQAGDVYACAPTLSPGSRPCRSGLRSAR